MKKIYLVGSQFDKTFAHTAVTLKKHGFSTIFIDLDDFLSGGFLEFDSSSGRFVLGNYNAETFSIESHSAVYPRLYDYHSDCFSGEALAERQNRMDALTYALQFSPATVIPRPLSDGENTSKIHQLHLLQHAGFMVPHSLATSNPEKAANFIELHSGNVIYKSVSSVRSIVKKVNRTKLDSLHLLCNCPVLFQECVAGPDIRLHLVGEDAFAEMITAAGVDYRYSPLSSRHFRPHHMPDHVLHQARQFMKSQGLTFAGFDFLISEETGEYYCLEANPNPGYEGYDFRANLAISASLGKSLAESTTIRSNQLNSSLAYISKACTNTGGNNAVNEM